MEHSKNYSKVKRYYDMGIWTIPMVKNAVAKGWITGLEFKEITGKAYREV